MLTPKRLRYDCGTPERAEAFAVQWRAFGYRQIEVVGSVVWWTEDTTD